MIEYVGEGRTPPTRRSLNSERCRPAAYENSGHRTIGHFDSRLHVQTYGHRMASTGVLTAETYRLTVALDKLVDLLKIILQGVDDGPHFLQKIVRAMEGDAQFART